MRRLPPVLLPPVLLPFLPAGGLRRSRGQVAAIRLRSARARFDLSMTRLRRAALDHVDRQILVGIALRAALDRLEAARS